MKFALKIGRFFDIDVFLHWSFAVVPVWIIAQGLMAGYPAPLIVAHLALTLGIFTCVVLHEYGHALAARRFGVRTKHIVLTPIGGIAALQSMPRDPVQELVIAVAGPLVNVAIAILLSPLALLLPGSLNLFTDGISAGGMIKLLLIVNVVLVVFNAIPAFPMDGGRVFRALLAFFLPYLDATMIAARVGQAIAVFAFVTSFMTGQVSLILIAVFIFVMAGNELRAAQWLEARRYRVEKLKPLLNGWLNPHLNQIFYDDRENFWRIQRH